MIDYTFGKEIVKFTLSVLCPGETTFANWGPTVVYIDPDTMTILKDDESSDPFLELVKQEDGVFDQSTLKILKTVWEINLHYFSGGGIDYEIHEGFFEYMQEWGPAAAEIFKEHFERSRSAQPDGQLVSKTIPEPPTYDYFYGLVNSWWSGSHSYWEDDLEFDMEFLGEVDETKMELA